MRVHRYLLLTDAVYPSFPSRDLPDDPPDDPAEIHLSSSAPNAINSIFKDVSSDEEVDTHNSCSTFVTPVAKRAKWDHETRDQNPRKLNYDSDELTQRHSPDSSAPGSPIVFFDLDADDNDEGEEKGPATVQRVSPTAEHETDKFDLSAGSPLIRSLRQLQSQMTVPPDDPYETHRDPSFVFGGPIPEGVELGFRTAANVPIHIPPNDKYVDLFADSQSQDTVGDQPMMKSVPSVAPLHLDPFQDSQMSDDLLQSVANREFPILFRWINFQ